MAAKSNNAFVVYLHQAYIFESLSSISLWHIYSNPCKVSLCGLFKPKLSIFLPNRKQRILMTSRSVESDIRHSETGAIYVSGFQK